MRELLFRGKDIYGKWRYGDLINLTNEIKQICNHTQLEHAHSVDIKTIGQYTGLTDKNGKRIFEGDVCKNTKTGEIVSVQWHGTMAGYVWSKRKENNQHLFDFGELFRAHDKYEVIGNIHDNPELLKGGEG